MNDTVIHCEGLGKKYTIGHQAANGRYETFRDVFMQNARGLWRKTKDLAQGKPIIIGDELEEVWALKDVSFEVKRGEVVGIIGRNGAGKSTLLKVLSRITEPTEGRVTIKGRVASLLEVGTGFHPELSGRENVYLNGAILGMTRAEIKKKFDEIVAFAEVEKFLDTPVKRYSSGMYVRLAFAVAAHLEPEILVVDEVLAVGDAQFQKKCLGKMKDVAGQGRTVLFVSHQLGMIQSLCARCILLESGGIVEDGETSLVVSKYLTGLNSVRVGECNFLEDKGKKAQIRRVAVMDEQLRLKTLYDVFEQVAVEIQYEVEEELMGSIVVMRLSRDGVVLFTSFDTDNDSELFDKRSPGYYRTRVNLPCPLKAGIYTIYVGTSIAKREVIDRAEADLGFEVEELSSTAVFRGYYRKQHGPMAADLVWKTTTINS